MYLVGRSMKRRAEAVAAMQRTHEAERIERTKKRFGVVKRG